MLNFQKIDRVRPIKHKCRILGENRLVFAPVADGDSGYILSWARGCFEAWTWGFFCCFLGRVYGESGSFSKILAGDVGQKGGFGCFSAKSYCLNTLDRVIFVEILYVMFHKSLYIAIKYMRPISCYQLQYL